MLRLTAQQLRYFVLRDVVGAAIVNFLINGALGWLIMQKRAEMPLWGTQSIAGDLVATAFGVSFGTGLVVTWLARVDVRKGIVAAPELSSRAQRALARLPAKTLSRSFVLGALSVPLFAPLAIGALAALGITALGPLPFLLVKGASSALQGAIVTPLIAIAAIVRVGE